MMTILSTAATIGSPLFELKSASLNGLTFIIKTIDMAQLADSLQQQLASYQQFFADELTIIDFSHCQAESLDMNALLALMASYGLRAVAFRHANQQLHSLALTLGLLPLPSLSTAPKTFPKTNSDSLVIEKPVRAGQQIYAKQRDLIVLAMVNNGAEVIADGHIHVYAPLRGRALAGARGNKNARIFSQHLAAELLSIAGIYRTLEEALPVDILGRAAQVYLVGEKLMIEALGSSSTSQKCSF